MKKRLLSVFFIFALTIALTATKRAEALYLFEWVDYNAEWYSAGADGTIAINNVTAWEGFFTVPDAAVNFFEYEHDGTIYKEFYINNTISYIDFSLLGVTACGHNFEATEFLINGLFGPVREDGAFYGAMGMLDFIVGNPSWSETPITFSKTDQDPWLYYSDRIFDEATSNWKEVEISHYGTFVGRYIADSPPVPEPSTILLLCCGLTGIAFKRKFSKNKTVCFR